MSLPEFEARPRWQSTGDGYFPFVATVDGTWWVLRVNAYPDHPAWTLFVNGAKRFDVDVEGVRPAWGRPFGLSVPALEARLTQEVLAPIRGFVAYGSEVGQPCDNPFCCG
ncbi:hypothetical protein [Embleya sp. NPDC005575]|uniref:hypothetical protein n=1 Tax=Embleya sp. NPDC005575 TaxID=3156892 RepID=UPI0033A803BC